MSYTYSVFAYTCIHKPTYRQKGQYLYPVHFHHKMENIQNNDFIHNENNYVHHHYCYQHSHTAVILRSVMSLNPFLNLMTFLFRKDAVYCTEPGH